MVHCKVSFAHSSGEFPLKSTGNKNMYRVSEANSIDHEIETIYVCYGCMLSFVQITIGFLG